MKRFLIIVLTLILSLSMVVPCVAVDGKALTEGNIEYFPDGSYAITLIETDYLGNNDKGTVSKTKSYSYYDNNDVLQWTVKLSATFSYNGVTASCTTATTSHIIYNTDWQVTKSEPSYSGNTATGEFTVKKYLFGIPIKTVNKTLTLTCSPGGVVT